MDQDLLEKRRKHAEYMRKYLNDNPEARKKANERGKLYRQQNPEQMHNWRENNKEHRAQYKRDYNNELKQTIEGMFIILAGNCRSIDKQKNRTEPSIDSNDIAEMYELQNGKCVYTNVELMINGAYQISVDRIDSSRGHSRDNCQLVILPINHFKSNMTHDDFLQLINNIRDNAGVNPEFVEYKQLTTKAKHKIHMLMSDIRRRSELAKRECNFKLDDFKQWRPSQRDICQITGVSVTWEPHQWNTASIDRIDSSRGYELDNIQVVIWPVNMMKNDYSNDEAFDVINLLM